MSLPKVSIIILAYLESNRAYFEACLESVKNLDYPRELLNVVVVSPWVKAQPPEVDTVLHLTGPGSFSKSVNAGVKMAHGYGFDSKHILLLSDDTIIAKNSLKNMVTTIGESSCLLGALSNCDQYWKYLLHLPHISLPRRFYKLSEVNPKELMNAESLYPGGILMTEALCFYALLIPRVVWQTVGELDEDFRMGYEDTDYCERAKELGFPCAIDMSSLIWHAGGASSEIIQDEWRVKNVELIEQKRALRKLKASS